MLDLSDTGVPVGTTEQIRYGQNLNKGRSTDELKSHLFLVHFSVCFSFKIE